jgi:DNA polymerase-3 subunit delta'
MAWASVIGQHRVKQALQRAVADNRVAHAYCFWGAEGIGKDALALEFAKLLNCENPQYRKQPEGSMELEESNLAPMPEACDECKSCRLANAIQHPNIQLVFSLPAAKNEASKSDSTILRLSDDQITAIKEQLQLKSENPYHNITLSQATQIRIAAVREIKKNISLSASQKGRRFVIVSEADAMNQEAANAFLKSLEEPTPNVTIILTTSRREQLLPTIMSRCQQVRCHPIDDDAIMQALHERKEIPLDDARLVARLADGSYSKACSLLEDDVQELRESVVKLLRSMLKGKNYILQLTHEIDSMARAKDRAKVERMLTLLLLWLRDAYTIRHTQTDSYVVNIDQIEDLQKFALNLPQADLHGATLAIEEAIEGLRRNVQLPLLLITLSLRIREHLLRK